MGALLRCRLCAFHDHVASVFRLCGFKQHYPAFVFRERIVFNALWHDMHIANIQNHIIPVSVANGQAAFDDEEQFVFVFMIVPDEFTLQLCEFDTLAVDIGDHPRRPMVGDLGEFFIDVADHGSNPLNDRCCTHAGTDAERDQRCIEIAPFQFIEYGSQDHRAGRA
jgi:hypothetical protein